MDISREERLAALLDGTCSDAEREELLALLAEDDDELEVFAAATAALSEYERQQPTPEKRPPPPRPPSVATATARRRWRPPRSVSLIAAGVVVAIVGLVLLPRPRSASGAAQVVSQLKRPSLPAGVDPYAGLVRGGPGSALSDPERVQLGAALVVLEVAGTSNPGRAREAAQQVSKLLRRTTAPPSLTQRYEAIGSGQAAAYPLDPELAGRVERIAGGTEATRFGEWLQAARIAAAQHDVDFFRTRESRRWLSGKDGPRMAAGAEQWFQRARTAAEPSTPHWEDLAQALESLYDAATR